MDSPPRNFPINSEKKTMAVTRLLFIKQEDEVRMRVIYIKPHGFRVFALPVYVEDTSGPRSVRRRLYL